jgi:hypothetical protein
MEPERTAACEGDWLREPFVRVDDLAEHGFGERKSLYEAVKRGDIPSVRLGRKVLIPTTWVREAMRLPLVMLFLVALLLTELKVVASAQSRRGGQLSCGHKARPGDVIHKIDTGDRGEGTTTSYGNGPGQWVCATCAHADQLHLDV